jgi:hypothetical protein
MLNMDKVKTRFYCQKGRGLFLYLPMKLVQDSAFQFSTGQTVTVSIRGDKLVVE